MSDCSRALKFLPIVLAVLMFEVSAPAIGADVPNSAKAFLGPWEGAFEGGRPTWLIVESVANNGNARVLYGMGQWGQKRERERRSRATIRDGVLRFRFRNGVELSYRMVAGNRLDGQWARGKRTISLRLTKTTGTPKKTASLNDCNDPLPDVVIIPPDADVPRKYAKFSGIWRGRWAGKRCSRLAIDLVEASGNVRYVLSFSRMGKNKAGYRSGYARIVDGKLEFGKEPKLIFRIDPSGKMRGEFHGGSRLTIAMEKIGAR